MMDATDDSGSGPLEKQINILSIAQKDKKVSTYILWKLELEKW